jgi:hypothetical protein
LHGIPAKKDRRNELRHQLIEIQTRVPEEMSHFSQEIDLREIAESVQRRISDVDLIDMLFIFADLARSPDPKKLENDALESIRKHPLSSIFGTSHTDHEGKVIHRTEGGGLLDGDNKSAIFNQIVQGEAIRRKIVAFGEIEAARLSITDRHYISDDTFVPLLQCSPFVPSDVTHTYARGFARFFQGDFISALYVLTPLLENSLRHILKGNGHDVTKFDDATQTQQDLTFSSLFEQKRMELDNTLSIAVASEIERLFLLKPGPHLRNALAHGLLHDGDPYGSDAVFGCWLIFRLCLLPLFKHHKEIKLALGFGTE